MINYPLGYKKVNKKKDNVTTYKNKGLALEELINESNLVYLNKNIALIYKKPTPINIVKTNKENRITSAYFEKKSTTDYNGLYKGKYLDFEAKSTALKTSFPLKNFETYQLDHLNKVIEHGGLAFFIVSFSSLKRYFVYKINSLNEYLKNNNRNSIPLKEFVLNGYELKLKLNPILDYLEAVNNLFSLQ